MPKRPAMRLHDLTPDEVTSLFMLVQRVGRVIEKAFKADALTIACQVGFSLYFFLFSFFLHEPKDGEAAGQSIPHVHVHILPRRFTGDRFEGANDKIYPTIEKSEQDLPHLHTAREVEMLKVDADEDRQPRTIEEMEREAAWLHEFFATT